MATEHRTIPADGIHIAHAFKTTDLGLLTVALADVDKLALLTTTGMYYRLSSVSPITWVQHGHTDAQVKAITHDIAEVSGLQTALDAKVDDTQVLTNVPVGALFTDTVYTHPTTDGSLHVPATSTTNAGKVLTAGATAGAITWETPTTGGVTVLDGLTDVTITTPVNGQALSYNGTIWVNTTPTSGVTDHTLLTNIGTNTHAQIDIALTRLANTSGTNTGDYVHPTTDGSLHVPATSTTNSGKVLTAGATAGSITWETIPAGVTDHTLLTNIGVNTHAQIDTALTRLANTSGTNTGDQDLSGYSLTTHNHTIDGLSNVVITNNSDNEVLAWDSVSSKWVNQTATEAGLATSTHNHTGVYEPADATILKSASIGSTVQGYDVDTAKLDVAQTFTAAQRGSVNTITYGATITPDFAVANNFSCTLTGNVTVANPTNIVVGQYGKITLTQDATGGRTTAWGTYFKFAGGTLPTYVTTANSVSTYYYEVASATQIVVSATIDWK